MRIQHGLGPCLALVASTPNDFGPSELVFPGLSTLVANTWPPKHLVEGELFHELSPSVRRCLELLDVLLSITLVMQDLIQNVRIRLQDTFMCAYMHIMLADQAIKGDLGILDMTPDSFIDKELEFRRHG